MFRRYGNVKFRKEINMKRSEIEEIDREREREREKEREGDRYREIGMTKRKRENN